MSDSGENQAGSSQPSSSVNGFFDLGTNPNISLSPVLGMTTTVAGKEEQKYPDSQNNGNGSATVITGAGEPTEPALYCNTLVDKAENKRQELLKNKSSFSVWWNDLDDAPPYEILQYAEMEKEADQLRRCIELASDINDEYKRLDEKTQELNRLMNEEGVKNSKLQKALDDLDVSRDAIMQLENSLQNMGPDTEIGYWIREAWKYDDRGFLTDVGIGVVPLWNASDSTYAATAYFNAGRPGMGALMSAFATADALSTAAVVAGGAGLATGGASGGVKSVAKSAIKKMLKKSAADLKALFSVFRNLGQMVTIRKSIKNAAEAAAKCARACIGR